MLVLPLVKDKDHEIMQQINILIYCLAHHLTKKQMGDNQHVNIPPKEK